MIFQLSIPLRMRPRAGAMQLRVSIGADRSTTFELQDGQTIETQDVTAIEAIRGLHGLYGISVTELVVRPGTISHDLDSKPRAPRPTTTTERTR